jgi:DNA-binding transcriptional MerR regulator
MSDAAIPPEATPPEATLPEAILSDAKLRENRMPELGFDDGKAPDALRTIGEVTRALGIRQHVLRYWEEQFPMLRPVKRSGNRRYYRPEDIALIAEIDRLVHREGFTLRGARLAMEAGKGKVVAPVPDAVAMPAPARSDDGDTAAPLASLRDELRAIRAELAGALARS